MEGDEEKEDPEFREGLSLERKEPADLEKELRDREQDIVELQRDLSEAKDKLSK